LNAIVAVPDQIRTGARILLPISKSWCRYWHDTELTFLPFPGADYSQLDHVFAIHPWEIRIRWH
jgi:hypothetical protein